MSKLNKDILFLLFEELKDDSKSLFSCLLVNRLWCETVVQILWRNPWHYDINYRNKSSLFNIVILSLTDDIKEILISQGVQFTLIMQKPFLFDYLSFCRSMNINAINDIISVGTSSSDYHQFLLQKEIYNLIMKKCSELKNLDMRSIEHQIFYIPEANARLNSLCELVCDINSDHIYFYGLACICNSIEKLIIVNDVSGGNNGIIKLIEVQRNLKYFEWKSDLDYVELPEVFYEKLSQVLVKKAHTLTHFIISAVDDYFVCSELFTKLHKLRTLKFNFNKTFEDTYEGRLTNSVYSNLEIFQISDYISINTVNCLIRNSEGHLREILINHYAIDIDWDEFCKQSLSLICTIYEKCPLVEYLSLAFPLLMEHLIELEKLLKACQKLLLLHIDYYVYDYNMNIEELLKVLSKSAPINLREIRFSDFKISLKSLEEFLEAWRMKRRPALIILYTFDHYDKEEYMGLINRYKNYGVPKDFRRVSSMIN